MMNSVILHSLEARFPPEQPALVEERAWPSVAGAQAERLGRRVADSFEKAADEWIASMDCSRLGAERVMARSAAVTEDMTVLSSVIDDFETLADLRAQRGAKLARRLARNVKATFGTDPAAAAALRSVTQRLVETEKRVIEALLDHALFLRALRSDIDPTARGGPTFSDAGELERHLAEFGAA